LKNDKKIYVEKPQLNPFIKKRAGLRCGGRGKSEINLSPANVLFSKIQYIRKFHKKKYFLWQRI